MAVAADERQPATVPEPRPATPEPTVPRIPRSSRRGRRAPTGTSCVIVEERTDSEGSGSDEEFEGVCEEVSSSPSPGGRPPRPRRADRRLIQACRRPQRRPARPRRHPQSAPAPASRRRGARRRLLLALKRRRATRPPSASWRRVGWSPPCPRRGARPTSSTCSAAPRPRSCWTSIGSRRAT